MYAGESLNISGYLTPYMESMAPNFRNGVNFGTDGGSLFPRSPFNLVVQVFQFLRFRTRSLELYSQGTHHDYFQSIRTHDKIFLFIKITLIRTEIYENKHKELS